MLCGNPSPRSVIYKNDADAEDVLQEAYLAAYRRIGDFRADARLSTWLTRIVINQALARLRSRHRATVRSRMFRARGMLRESVARELDMATDDVFRFAGERCDRVVAGVLARCRALVAAAACPASAHGNDSSDK